MSKFFTSTIASVAAIAVLAPVAAHAVPFTQAPTNTVAPSGASDANTETFSADDFVLSSTSTITDVTWWGNTTDIDAPGISGGDDFAIYFYTDDGGLPALISIDILTPVVASSPTGNLDFSGEEIIEYSASIMGPELTGGLTYWIAIENSTSDEWVWAASDAGGSFFFTDGVDEFLVDGALAFSLDGEVTAVSEPGALSLLGFGLLAAGFASRRRK